jgi:hypothetical protein
MIFLGAGGNRRTAEFRKDKTIRDPGMVARTAARYQPIRKSCHLSLYECRVASHSGFGANDQQIDGTAVVEAGEYS